MAVKTWTLIDVDRNIYEEELQLDGDVRVAKRRLRGGLSDGVDLVEIDNGKFSFGVVPTRGMNLWRAKMGDTNIGWTSPIRGPVHPTFVPFAEPSGLGWVEGFDELMARCGLESNGAPEFDEDGRVVYPLHGRISNKPAHRVDITQDQSTGEIAITGVVDETRFHFMKLRLTSTYRTLPGENGLRIHDEVTNLSGSPTEAQLLYHTNFGAPLLDAGASFVAPIDRVTPRNEHAAEGITNWQCYAAPQPGTEELAGPGRRCLHDGGDAEERPQHNGRGVARGRRSASLFHGVEKYDRARRWLRYGPGTGHEFSEYPHVRR